MCKGVFSCKGLKDGEEVLAVHVYLNVRVHMRVNASRAFRV